MDDCNVCELILVNANGYYLILLHDDYTYERHISITSIIYVIGGWSVYFCKLEFLVYIIESRSKKDFV